MIYFGELCRALVLTFCWMNFINMFEIIHSDCSTVWPVKSCQKVTQKMISLEKLKILTPSQKLPKNVGDLGKLIVATGYEKLPQVQ